MRNIWMVASYDGTRYNGFQSQPQKNTIQDKIEEAIAMLTGERVKIISSGRTDAGVHARGQVFNFLTSSQIPIRSWCLALNSRLPDDIKVMQAKEVSLEFHARRQAKQKTYRYTINGNRVPDVFLKHVQFHHPARLDVDAMEQGLSHLIGEHDFTSFCSTRSTKESHVRTIIDAWIEREDRNDLLQPNQVGVFHIYITGSGFLYNMVRIIVGTLIQVGEGKRNSIDMLRILEAQNRAKAGPTAVAHGLTLWEVCYDDEQTESDEICID